MTLPSASGGNKEPNNPPSSGTTYTDTQKYDAIVAQCMADITSYDAMTSSLSSALTNKKGNCFPFAEYIKIACDSVGIDCDVIYGTSDTSSYNVHVWNRVTLDGTKYWSDITSCISMGNTMFAKSKNDLMSFSNYKDYAYVLDVKNGTYKQLPSVSLTATAGTVTNTCNYASITASQGKSEYSSNYDTISNKFTQYA